MHPKTIDMGLARVASVARTLGADKPSSRVITVGGTNGKGSTVAHMEAILRVAGVSTGMFTSPHFIRYNERIRVGGVEVGDAELISAFERIEAARGSTTLTFFEYNALAALLIFADRRVDVAILEVGLGGRLDAVNLVDADVSIVCSIGFDHRDYLGDSLEQIGAEKAGIFRSGRPAVLSTPDMPASVYATIQRLGARTVVAERDFSWQVESSEGQSAYPGAPWSYRGLRISLSNLPASALEGSIQYRNASASIAAIESLDAGYTLNEQTVGDALRSVRLPVGILTDKDAREIAAALEPLVDHWILCSLPGARGSSASDLAVRLRLPPDEVTLATSVEEGCEVARAAAVPGDRVIVFGSVYTVGPALQWLRVY